MRFRTLIFAMTALSTAQVSSFGEAPIDRSALLGWKLFSPLPDAVGFAGMVAGVLDGKLVAAGGSQFPSAPNWLKGEKAFSDRIFTLESPTGGWKRGEQRLPHPVANPACASQGDTIYFAGGLDSAGCLKSAWAMRAQGDGFSFSRLADLPEAVGYSAGAIVAGRFYVAAGLNTPDTKKPSIHLWSLDVSGTAPAAAWRREPDLPGPGVFVAAASAAGSRFYVFAGIGFDAAGKSIPSKRAYALETTTGQWSDLPDLPAARVGISTPCPVVDDQIWAIGGYSTIFPGPPREHPGFDAATFSFDLKSQAWRRGPTLPTTPVVNRDSPGDAGPTPMIGAPCVVWKGYAVIVGGEVRASVRTPAVVAWPLNAKF
jgi:N-acetylneuraminate epimerase